MGLDVRVHDAYVAGAGEMNVKLAGMVTLSHLRGTPDMAQGELMRWLAEACWYPNRLASQPRRALAGGGHAIRMCHLHGQRPAGHAAF
jgi:hypothetical protein